MEGGGLLGWSIVGRECFGRGDTGTWIARQATAAGGRCAWLREGKGSWDRRDLTIPRSKSDRHHGDWPARATAGKTTPAVHCVSSATDQGARGRVAPCAVPIAQVPRCPARCCNRDRLAQISMTGSLPSPSRAHTHTPHPPHAHTHTSPSDHSHPPLLAHAHLETDPDGGDDACLFHHAGIWP